MRERTPEEKQKLRNIVPSEIATCSRLPTYMKKLNKKHLIDTKFKKDRLELASNKELYRAIRFVFDSLRETSREVCDLKLVYASVIK